MPDSQGSVLIADDEDLARQRLRYLVDAEPNWHAVGEACDGHEATRQIVALRPDVVLLDIRMPLLNGFEVLKALDTAGRAEKKHVYPAVIFVTAHESHAVHAFEVRAVDYLLKPVDQARLREALHRATLRNLEPDTFWRRGGPALQSIIDSVTTRPAFPVRFPVRSGDVVYFVRADEIDWIDTARNYLQLHTAGRVHLIRETMSSFETKLDPTRFARVHRSALVNLDRVRKIQSHERGEYLITLADGTRLTTSRMYSVGLREILR